MSTPFAICRSVLSGMPQEKRGTLIMPINEAVLSFNLSEEDLTVWKSTTVKSRDDLVQKDSIADGLQKITGLQNNRKQNR